MANLHERMFLDRKAWANSVDTEQGSGCSWRIILIRAYHKNPKISDTQKFAVITLKVEQDGFSLE